MIKDARGNQIHTGNKARLLKIENSVLELIPENDRKKVISMIGEEVEVYDLRGEFVCIEKSWHRGRGKTEYQMLSVKGEHLIVLS